MTRGGDVRLHAARLCAVAASVFLLATTVIVAGWMTPGYSHAADTVSRLASPGQPHARAVQAGIVVYGLLVVAGCQALTVHAPGRERLLAALVGLYGLAAVVAGVAAKDPPAARHTAISAVHVDATVAGGIGVVAAMVVVASCAAHPALRRISLASAFVTCVAAVVFRYSWGSSVYGLVERVLVGVPATWVAAVAVVRPSGRGAENLASR